MSEQLFKIRPMVPGDKSFIMSTWLKGLKFGNDLFKEVKADVYFKAYQKILDQLLAHPSVKVNVACLPDDEDVILGYAAVSKDDSKIHFVFVKSAWRKMGIAKALVPETIKTATHITKTGLSLLRKKAIDFDPFNIV